MLKQNQMLKSITKFFSGEKGSDEMKKTETQADMSAVEMAAQLKQAQEAFSAQAADMQAMQELMEEMSSKLEQASAALAATEAAKAALVAEAAAKRLTARKERIEAAIGTEKAPALLAATETMEDAAFEAVVSALAGSVEQEAKGKMFTETGVAAEAKPVVVDPVQKLAAAIAAQFPTN